MATEAHILANLPKYPPLYICKEPSTNQLLIMQNKPNFLRYKMSINPVMKKHYEQKTPLRPPPKQSQSNPISAPDFLSCRLLTGLTEAINTYLRLHKDLLQEKLMVKHLSLSRFIFVY
jgi:hypothetical protein